MAWKVDNSDGYFSEGHANEVWNGDPPQAWQMKYTLAEFATNPASSTILLYLHFDITEVEGDGEIATIFGVHKLARLWAKPWTRAHRREVDWATHAISRGVTL